MPRTGDREPPYPVDPSHMSQPIEAPAGRACPSLAAAVLQNRARRLLGLQRREAAVALLAAGGFVLLAAALLLAGAGRPGPDAVLVLGLVAGVAVLPAG